eukprot:g511.t1
MAISLGGHSMKKFPTLLDKSPSTASNKNNRGRSRSPASAKKKFASAPSTTVKSPQQVSARKLLSATSSTLRKAPFVLARKTKKSVKALVRQMDGDLEKSRARGVYWACVPLLGLCLLYRFYCGEWVRGLFSSTGAALLGEQEQQGPAWSSYLDDMLALLGLDLSVNSLLPSLNLNFNLTELLGLEGVVSSVSLSSPAVQQNNEESALAIVVGTLLVCANTVVRLKYPSSYMPARQVGTAFWKSPIFARVLATLCEFAFYKLEAYTFGLPFYTVAEDGSFHLGTLGLLATVGELLCWCHVLLQSELLGWLEDCTWTTLQISTLLLLSNSDAACYHLALALLLPYILHMKLLLLPRQFKRIVSQWRLASAEGRRMVLANGWRGVKKNSNPDAGTLSWMTTSLLAAPAMFGVLLCTPANGGATGAVADNVLDNLGMAGSVMALVVLMPVLLGEKGVGLLV